MASCNNTEKESRSKNIEREETLLYHYLLQHDYVRGKPSESTTCQNKRAGIFITLTKRKYNLQMTQLTITTTTI